MRNNSKITYFKKGTDKKKQITVEKHQSAGSCPGAVFLHIQFKCLTKKKKIPQNSNDFLFDTVLRKCDANILNGN